MRYQALSIAALASLLALFGCSGEGGTPDPGDTPTPDPLTQDRDGDGYSPDEGDCDDLDRDVSPGAAEYCDGADNNCDGEVDEDGAVDSQTLYADQDGDGYGDAAFTLQSCDIPPRFVSNALDCNDGSALDRPGADELCDDRDNDCDSLVDEGVPSDAATFYLDADGDGFGVADVTVEACEAPPGYAIKANDCDDAEARAYPGNVEVCDGVDNNCDGNVDVLGVQNAPTWYQDVDGDGFGQPGTALAVCVPPFDYVAEGGDCDEEDVAINPGATEICDGKDNDCDGEIDGPESDDARAFFRDADGDGFGDPAHFEVDCAAPEGFVPQNTDCDDAAADVHPGAAEHCSAEGEAPADEDCDGAVDEAGAADAAAHYPDVDGDGYGDATDELLACALPEGRIPTGGDCDDADSAVNPGAQERCDDGEGVDIDNDCDGLVDEGGAVDALPTWPDVDGDGYGADVDPTPACAIGADQTDGPGDCDDSDPNVKPGVEEICDDGVDNNCDGSPGECTLRYRAPETLGDADIKIIGTQASAYLGEDVSMVGDVNGDGYGDILIGAWSYDPPGVGVDGGAAFLFYGPLLPRTRGGRIFDREADVLFYGALAGDHAGTAVKGAGDVNGDGYADVLIGSNLAQEDQVYQGATYLFYGPIAPGTYSVEDADVTLFGDHALDYAGTFLAAAGDLNQDGLDDILIGAPGVDAGGVADVGAAYVLYGPIPKGVHRVGDLGVRLVGALRGDGAGHGVAGGRDLNGDGRPDIVVGAPFSSEGGASAGKIYVLTSPLSPGAELKLETEARATFLGENLGQGNAGYVVAVAGDVHGDGLDDLLIGAPRTDTDGRINNGTAYIVRGPALGHRALSAPPDVFFDGSQSDDQAAISLAGPGDLDLDHKGDIVVGAWRADLSGQDAGAVGIFYGPATASGIFFQAQTLIVGEVPGDQAGVALDGGGDLNGDGVPDLLVGALGQSGGAPQGGAAYIVLGRGF